MVVVLCWLVWSASLLIPAHRLSPGFMLSCIRWLDHIVSLCHNNPGQTESNILLISVSRPDLQSKIASVIDELGKASSKVGVCCS